MARAGSSGLGRGSCKGGGDGSGSRRGSREGSPSGSGGRPGDGESGGSGGSSTGAGGGMGTSGGRMGSVLGTDAAVRGWGAKVTGGLPWHWGRIRAGPDHPRSWSTHRHRACSLRKVAAEHSSWLKRETKPEKLALPQRKGPRAPPPKKKSAGPLARPGKYRRRAANLPEGNSCCTAQGASSASTQCPHLRHNAMRNDRMSGMTLTLSFLQGKTATLASPDTNQ